MCDEKEPVITFSSRSLPLVSVFGSSEPFDSLFKALAGGKILFQQHSCGWEQRNSFKGFVVLPLCHFQRKWDDHLFHIEIKINIRGRKNYTVEQIITHKIAFHRFIQTILCTCKNKVFTCTTTTWSFNLHFACLPFDTKNSHFKLECIALLLFCMKHYTVCMHSIIWETKDVEFLTHVIIT